MHYKLLYPSTYLSSADLLEKDVTLTIKRVVVEELRSEGGSEDKPVVYFEETAAKAKSTGTKEKRLVLNKTNATTIASIHGNEVDDWKGKRITLFPTTAPAFGETKECIRIRPTAPAPKEKD